MTTAPGVVYFTQPLTGAQSFACSKMRCDLSAAACAGNYQSGRYLSCKGCSTGAAHAGKTRTAADIARDPSAERHARSAAKNSLPCVRCGRGPSDSPTLSRHRLIGRLHCPSCDMRSREHLRGGFNSKGGLTVKHRHLRAVTVDVLMSDGTMKTLKPFVTGSDDETRRALDRLRPGWEVGQVRYPDGTTADIEPEKE